MKQKRNTSNSSQSNIKGKLKNQQQHCPEFQLSEESNPIIPNEFQQNNEIIARGSMQKNLLPSSSENSLSNNRVINPTIINFQYFPHSNDNNKTNDDNDTLINPSISNNPKVSNGDNNDDDKITERFTNGHNSISNKIIIDQDMTTFCEKYVLNNDSDNENNNSNDDGIFISPKVLNNQKVGGDNDSDKKSMGKCSNGHNSISNKIIINQDVTKFCEKYVLDFHPTSTNSDDDDYDNASPSENDNEIVEPPKKSKKSSKKVSSSTLELPVNPINNEPDISFIQFLSEIVVDSQIYKPIKLIGSGSFGSVFLVVDEKTKNQYAVKLFNCNLTTQLAERQFIREIEIMNIANHPLVCRLKGFSFFSNSGLFTKPFIITKFYPNGSLRDAIEGNKKLDPTQKQITLYAIAIAMKYLHEIGIVHRDLKADNILFDEFNRPIICDFGLSKIMVVNSMIQTTVSGSITYMAPELLKHIEYTKSIDVYAYAFVCYELLTEKTVFEDITNIFAFANDVCKKNKRPSLKIKQSIISTSFKAMIKSAWDGDPNKRPTFEQIVNDFELGNIKSKEVDEKIFNDFILSIKKI